MEPQYDLLFQNTPKGKKLFKALRNTWFVMGLIVTVLILVGFGYLIWFLCIDDGMPEEIPNQTTLTTKPETKALEDGCNVMVIKLHGKMGTYSVPGKAPKDEEGATYNFTTSEDVRSSIELAERDSKIEAIILEVDSPGGSPIAGEEIANALKRTEKPTVALIREIGASSAYWASTGADTIFASKNSDVGSIGITSSYVDYSKRNEKEGITYNQLSTGPLKNSGDPDKPLTALERVYFERDLNIMLDNFVLDVSTNRKLSINKVRQLADGSSMLGEQALKNGLIDKIGDIYTVKEFLKEKIGEEINICWE